MSFGRRKNRRDAGWEDCCPQLWILIVAYLVRLVVGKASNLLRRGVTIGTGRSDFHSLRRIISAPNRYVIHLANDSKNWWRSGEAPVWMTTSPRRSSTTLDLRQALRLTMPSKRLWRSRHNYPNLSPLIGQCACLYDWVSRAAAYD